MMEGGISIRFLLQSLSMLGSKGNKNVQGENCCVPGEPDRYRTSAVSDQLHNNKQMNTINCTQIGNSFNLDINVQLLKLSQNYHAYFHSLQ
jgi:hypothetical protein